MWNDLQEVVGLYSPISDCLSIFSSCQGYPKLPLGQLFHALSGINLNQNWDSSGPWHYELWWGVQHILNRVDWLQVHRCNQQWCQNWARMFDLLFHTCVHAEHFHITCMQLLRWSRKSTTVVAGTSLYWMITFCHETLATHPQIRQSILSTRL